MTLTAVASPTILTVDDNAGARYAAARILRNAGYRVLEAANGSDALALVKGEQPDLVLLDVRLPDISGLEVCKRIKADPATAFIPVLQMSASFVNTRDTVRGLESGADAYLTEPIEPSVLLATVKALMRLRLAESALRESEARHRLLFESNPLPTWLVDAASLAILAVNTAAVTAYGYTREEFLDMTLLSLMPRDEHPSFVAAAAQAEERVLEPSRQVKKDGAVLDVEITLAPVPLRGREARLVIATDVTERRRIEQARAELFVREREAREQAEAANRAKDEFLAMLSHELRTPLNATYGWARILRRSDLDPATVHRAVDVIERNTTLQSKLIDDLLDVSRIISGKLSLRLEPLDFGEVVVAATEAARSHAEANGLRLEVDVKLREATVSGDRHRLQQVLGNLLSNAVKFTPRGGVVTVRMEAGRGEARVIVRDTGAGIKPEFMPYIFERFRQADSSSARAFSGLGLGLAIVRHLVELHGGTVTAHSAGRQGEGATFTVTLPLARGVRVVDHAFGEPPPLSTEPRLDGVHVLVVDDDDDGRALVTAVLESAGARVTPAASTAEGLTALDVTVPDVLVSDIGMAGDDGYMFMQEVRRRLAVKGIRMPAMALTAYAMADDAARALEAGFEVHVAKPVEPAYLIGLVARLARPA